MLGWRSRGRVWLLAVVCGVMCLELSTFGGFDAQFYAGLSLLWCCTRVLALGKRGAVRVLLPTL